MVHDNNRRHVCNTEYVILYPALQWFSFLHSAHDIYLFVHLSIYTIVLQERLKAATTAKNSTVNSTSFESDG